MCLLLPQRWSRLLISEWPLESDSNLKTEKNTGEEIEFMKISMVCKNMKET
jgi:hypothetical protein